MKDNLTEIVVILDRSGSMSGLRDDAIGGFNSFIEDQRKVPGDALVTLVQFDHEYEEVYGGKPLPDVPLLDATTYSPRGSTALLDAMGRTMNDVGTRLASMDGADRPGKVIVVVITDGHENASNEFTHDKIKEMVEHQKDAYNWEFVFLASEPKTADMAQAIGIKLGNVALFAADSKGVGAAYAASTRAVSSYRTSGSTGDSLEKDDSGTVK